MQCVSHSCLLPSIATLGQSGGGHCHAFISASEEISLEGGACPGSEVGFEFLSVGSKAQVLVPEGTNQIQN